MVKVVGKVKKKKKKKTKKERAFAAYWSVSVPLQISLVDLKRNSGLSFFHPSMSSISYTPLVNKTLKHISAEQCVLPCKPPGIFPAALQKYNNED